MNVSLPSFKILWNDYLLFNSQRNDAVDIYGTYPIHIRPHSKLDSFEAGVQRTQFVCFISFWMVYIRIDCALDRQPIVTGTSVLAIKYKDGIMMTADTLGTPQLSAFFKFCANSISL